MKKIRHDHNLANTNLVSKNDEGEVEKVEPYNKILGKIQQDNMKGTYIYILIRLTYCSL
jgi:hypothetical protein